MMQRDMEGVKGTGRQKLVREELREGKMGQHGREGGKEGTCNWKGGHTNKAEGWKRKVRREAAWEGLQEND